MIFAPMNYHYLHYPLIKFLNKVEKSPFNSVDLYCAGPQFNIYSYPLADLINLDKAIHARHLQVAVVTPENFSYPVNFCTLDRQTVEDSLRYYQRAIDTAVFLGCPKVQISIGSGYFDESSVEVWKRSRENLEIIVQYCSKKGVVLLLEELKKMNSNVINTSQQLANMLREIDSPHLVGMMDIDQMVCCNETPKDYFTKLGNKLQHIHFNDQGHTVPGDGTYPMRDYFHQILDSGYAGTCSFEICDKRYFKKPDEAFDKCVKWLQENTDELNGAE